MKGKKALVYDSGLFIHMSQELAKQFDKVYYYNHWQGDGFPMPNDYYIGVGFEFEKIWDFWRYVDKVDVIIFPDILCGDMQVFLRKKGYNVWGSGMGEELEIYRAESKELLKEIGLPVNKYEVVEGFESLKDFLKNKEDKYIKINSNIRGLKETFHYDDYKLSQPLFNEIKAKITGYEDMIEFVVEDPIDSVVEPGTDTYCINGDYPDKMLFAYEIKNEAYIGKVTSKTIYPKPLKNTLEKLSPIMKKYNYRGFFSTEEKVTKDRKSYLIDTTARLGMPSGGGQMGIISNWGEIIYNGAQGKLVQPEFRAKYVAELMMECDYSKEHQNAIHYPEKISDLIKMGYCMKKDGIVYTLPKYTNCIGTITVTGNTPQEIKDKMEDAKEQVHGYGLCIEMDHLECAFDAMKEGEKYL